ncbi:MAG: Lipase/Acylhydrolase with GDSL-like motif [Paenibacillaceae bacterium]|jgi:lysophospholipase L1-like esterase|nr:Lipase/Acylhydrolase with GDSL-like motif [Paenibacillaceae bacterium]
MGNTNRLWRITGAIGLISTLVLVAGLIYGVKTVLYPSGDKLPEAVAVPSEQETAGQKDKVQILAMGDSLTKGVGDDSGEGYVFKVKKLLEDRVDKPVYVWNFAVNGAKTSDLLAELNKPTARDYISQADIIMFTIGGNDLNQAAAASGQTMDTLPTEISFQFDELSKQLPETVGRFNEIIDKFAEFNPDAQIVYVGLYHPFAEFDTDRLGSLWLGKWNDAAFQAANRHANVTVVPTYDLFQNHWQDYLYTDHFHPNEAAYEQIALRVAQVLK